LAWAALANYTVDDASSLVEYRAALWAHNPNLTAFDITKLNNGTVTFIHPDPNGTPTVAMNFSGGCLFYFIGDVSHLIVFPVCAGTAIYIFVAYPSGKTNTVPLGFVAFIDDFPSGEWTADQIAPLSNFLAFSNTTLTNKPHTLQLRLHPGASLYFDYAIVTYVLGVFLLRRVITISFKLRCRSKFVPNSFEFLCNEQQEEEGSPRRHRRRCSWRAPVCCPGVDTTALAQARNGAQTAHPIHYGVAGRPGEGGGERHPSHE
jgi:hypothetical protein